MSTRPTVPPAGTAFSTAPGLLPLPADMTNATLRRSRSSGTGAAVANVLLLAFAAAVLVAVAWLLSRQLGTGAFVACGILALVPLGICSLGLHWIDRWDPEPRGALWFAFLWGAGAAVAVTVLLGNLVADFLLEVFTEALPLAAPDAAGAVLQAPLVEETAKGLGVLVLMLSRRSHFDGPVDGIVYAGTVAAGFAFTENILYFGAAYTAGGGPSAELTFTFLLRGLLSPFAHVLFTAALGAVLGSYAARSGRPRPALASVVRLALVFVLGLVPAVAGHMLWNGGTLLFPGSFFSFYLLLEVPLFAAAVTAVLLLRRAERQLTFNRLADYQRAGWFTDGEVRMLATPAGRRRARAIAGARGARREMREFERTAMRLAAVRHRMLLGHRREAAAAEQDRLLELAVHQRQALLASFG